MNKKWQTNVNNYMLKVKELASIKELLKAGKSSKALAELYRYQEKYPEDMFSKYLLAKVYATNGEVGEAKKLFRKISESNASNRYSALIEIAKFAEMEEDFETAKNYYQLVLDKSPYDEWYAKLSLARIEKEQGNYEKAKELLKKMTKVSPEVIALELVKIKREENDLVGASLLIETINTQNDPVFAREIDLEKALIEKEFNNYDAAQSLLKQAQEGKIKDKIYWKALYEEALLLYQTKEYKKALDACEKLSKSPTELKGKIALLQGKLLQNMEYYQEAYECFKTSFQKGGSKVRRESAIYLGNFALALGDFPTAKEHYQIATEKEKIFIKEAYKNLLAIAIKEEDYQAAYKYIEKLKKRNEKDKNMRAAKVYVEKKLGKLEKTPTDYIGSQIIDYDSEMALEYIRNREFNRKFAEDINIEQLFSTISKNFSKENQIYTEILDVYDIDYPEIGYVDGKITHTLRVVVTPHTTNILTMYPYTKKNIKNQIISGRESNKKKIKR